MTACVLRAAIAAASIVWAAGCCGGDSSGGAAAPGAPASATPAPVAPTSGPATKALNAKLLSATFSKGVSAEGQPLSPTTSFLPTETVDLALVFEGRPATGVVGCAFKFHDSMVAETSMDLTKVNKGILFSFGQDTRVWFNLTHEKNLWVGNYHADVTFDGQPVGTYAFAVVPPPGSTPVKLLGATLCKGATDDYVPVMPTTTFDASEKVSIAGRIDIGVESWIQADWTVNGQPAPEATRSITATQNGSNVGFMFDYLPAGGWPPGQHAVVLTMNDQQVGRYDFTTTGVPAGAPPMPAPPIGGPAAPGAPMAPPPPVQPTP